MRQLIAGNWKMNGLGDAALAEIAALRDAQPRRADILVCPPATLIARAAWVARGAVPIGAQDCHAEISGAFTGDVSAEMLKDAGAVAVIVGHSERRQYHGEGDADVAAKARAAWRAGLNAIVCVGETEAERLDGKALDVVARQLAGSVPGGAKGANTAIAYEPSGPSAPGARPARRRSSRCTRISAPMSARTCASSMAARSSRPTPRRSSPSPMSTARWWAARA